MLSLSETSSRDRSLMDDVDLHGRERAHCTEAQLRERQRRVSLVASLLSMRSRGVSLRSAAALIGEPAANLSRYLREYETSGADALIPATTSGRPPKFTLSEAEKSAIRLLRLKKGSAALAIEWFARDAACQPATRTLILAELDRAARRKREPHWPESLRKACHVTQEEEDQFRGPKHAQALEHMTPRGLWWIDEAGRPQSMEANIIWESDDMSLNEPFSWLDPETGETRVGRQTLCTQDVFTRFWLGNTLIGRSRDAYRVEDIADHMREVVALHGLPLAWRLERGVWENTFIDGIKIGVDGEGNDVTWGGLDAVMNIQRTFKSRGKGGIESSFDLLQDLIAHESLHIGRSRGEFEAATKHYLAATSAAASREKREASAAHFWAAIDASAGLAKAMEDFNLRPKKRRGWGRDLVVPADLFHAAPRRELPQSEAWRFLPFKAMATVRNGHVEKVVPHYPLPFRFTVNGVFDSYLPHGHNVLIAFHPGHPENGCHVFNFETGTRNRDGFKVGELLLIAPLAEDAPQFNLSKEDRDLVARKNANAKMRADFRGIVPAGRKTRAASTTRDGWGNAATRRTGEDSETSSAPAPVKTSSRRIVPDEDAELARVERLEREARERGDLLPS